MQHQQVSATNNSFSLDLDTQEPQNNMIYRQVCSKMNQRPLQVTQTIADAESTITVKDKFGNQVVLCGNLQAGNKIFASQQLLDMRGFRIELGRLVDCFDNYVGYAVKYKQEQQFSVYTADGQEAHDYRQLVIKQYKQRIQGTLDQLRQNDDESYKKLVARIQ